MNITFNTGDLLETVEEIIIRSDGLALRNSDGPFDKSELRNAITYEPGLQVSFVKFDENDPQLAIVMKGIIGTVVAIDVQCLKLLSSIDEN